MAVGTRPPVKVDFADYCLTSLSLLTTVTAESSWKGCGLSSRPLSRIIIGLFASLGCQGDGARMRWLYAVDPEKQLLLVNV